MQSKGQLHRQPFLPNILSSLIYLSQVERVTVSQRLEGTPCVLVTSQYGYSANMERIMKAQAFADPSRAQFLLAKKTMEINPRHPIIAKLAALAEADADVTTTGSKDLAGADLAMLLYDTALLNSGFSIDDTKDFAGRMYRLMKSGLSLDSLDPLPEPVLPSETPEPKAAAADDEEDDGEEEGEEEAEGEGAGSEEL